MRRKVNNACASLPPHQAFQANLNLWSDAIHQSIQITDTLVLHVCVDCQHAGPRRAAARRGKRFAPAISGNLKKKGTRRDMSTDIKSTSAALQHLHVCVFM
jgi:hypothetical protein